MTSKDVDKLLRAELWPAVREQGFVVRGRTGRRYRDHTVDVVNVLSYDPHQATVMGVTTFSFQLNAGVWPTFVPDEYGVDRDARGRPLPGEYHCAFRNSDLIPTIAAPRRKRILNPFAFRPLPQPAGVWTIGEDGSNAAA